MSVGVQVCGLFGILMEATHPSLARRGVAISTALAYHGFLMLMHVQVLLLTTIPGLDRSSSIEIDLLNKRETVSGSLRFHHYPREWLHAKHAHFED